MGGGRAMSEGEGVEGVSERKRGSWDKDTGQRRLFPLSRSLLGTVRDSTREARVGFAYVRILPAIGVELMEHASHTRAHARLTCCSGPYGIASMSSAHAVRGDMLVGEGGAIRICDVFILLMRAPPPPPQPPSPLTAQPLKPRLEGDR